VLAELGDLLVGDRQAELLLRFGHGEPQPSPGRKLTAG
jgi:hypothetical protein